MATLSLPVFGFFDFEISLIRRAKTTRPKATLDPISQTKSELIEYMEFGYTDPETGKHHELPAFAKTQIRNGINLMGLL